jgi:hypothetical protein
LSAGEVNKAERAELDALLERINARLAFSRIVSVGTRTQESYVDMPLLRFELRPEFRGYGGASSASYDRRVLDGIRRAAAGAFTVDLGDQADAGWHDTAFAHCALDVERAGDIPSALPQWPAFDDHDRHFLEAAPTDADLDEVIRARWRANHAALVFLAEEINDELLAHTLQPATMVSSGYATGYWNGLGVFRLGYKPHKPGQEIHDEDEMNRDVDLISQLAAHTHMFAFADEIEETGIVPFEAPEGIVLLCDASDPQLVRDELLRVVYEEERGP